MNNIYIDLKLRIYLENDVDIEQMKEMLLNNGTSVPSEGCFVYHGDRVVGKIRKAAATFGHAPIG